MSGKPKVSGNRSKPPQRTNSPNTCQWAGCGASLEGADRYCVTNQSAWTTLNFSWEIDGTKWLGYVQYHVQCQECGRNTVVRRPILEWKKHKKDSIPIRRKHWEKERAKAGDFVDARGDLPQ